MTTRTAVFLPTLPSTLPSTFLFIFLSTFLSLFFAATAMGAEGLQTRHPAVLFDAPSDKARPLFIVTAHQPLKTARRVHGWRKVSNFSDDSGWIRAADVRPILAGVVLGESAAVKTDPHEQAPVVFIARRGVVLEVLGRRQNWIQVLHEDGDTGYIVDGEFWLNH